MTHRPFDLLRRLRVAVASLLLISAKLDATLSRIQAGMNEEGGSRNGSRGNFTLNQTNNFGSPDNRTANQVASATARRQRAASARLGS